MRQRGRLAAPFAHRAVRALWLATHSLPLTNTVFEGEAAWKKRPCCAGYRATLTSSRFWTRSATKTAQTCCCWCSSSQTLETLRGSCWPFKTLKTVSMVRVLSIISSYHCSSSLRFAASSSLDPLCVADGLILILGVQTTGRRGRRVPPYAQCAAPRLEAAERVLVPLDTCL
jgi:hypothetical protein